jgi:RNA polymerase sigma-70 factor (ECF subfamily)
MKKKMISVYTLPQTSIAEQKMISLLREKQKEGFDLLYDTYSAPLYIISLNITGNKTKALEVLENTFIFIWKNICSYTPAKGRFGIWLVWITKQEAFKKTSSPIS